MTLTELFVKWKMQGKQIERQHLYSYTGYGSTQLIHVGMMTVKKEYGSTVLKILYRERGNSLTMLNAQILTQFYDEETPIAFGSRPDRISDLRDAFHD